jgi:splicing factor 3B subunit 1
MKKIVLKVVKQCVSSDGVNVSYVRDEIMEEFFRNFWLRRNALDKKNYKSLIETTVEIAGRVGGAEIVKKIVELLKDDSETIRKIVMETLENIVATYGIADVNAKLEERLMDGILFAFQEQNSEDT